MIPILMISPHSYISTFLLAKKELFIYNYGAGDNMEFDLTRLNSNIDSYLDVDLVYTFSKDKLEGTDLTSLDDVKISGTISKDSIGSFIIDVNVEGVMVLPCSITLDPVSYPFSINISGDLEEMMKEIDENAKKIVNSIDIFPIIWENILMEIPSKVTSPKASNMNLEGEGWKLVTEKDGNTNPELAKLKDLL